MNREAIYSALFNLAKAATGITTSGRFVVPIGSVPQANLPALFQHQVSDDPANTKGEPAILKLKAELVIYVASPSDWLDTSVSAPAIQLNNFLDALDKALQPDPTTQVQTLGGLVSHCWRTTTNYFEDAPTNQAALVVGIEMLTEGDSSAQFSFDSGKIFLTDPNGTPLLLGSLQDIQFTQKFDTHKVRGNFQYPVVVTRTSAQFSAKAKFAQINGAVLAEVVNGLISSTGSQLVQSGESHTIPGAPYQVAVTPPSGTFTQDMGVIYDSGANAGQALTAVSGTPNAGQYSVSGNTYTFSSADSGTDVVLSYIYTASTGKQVTISNPFSGITPKFQAVFNASDKNGNQVTWNFPVCYSDQLDIPTRLEKFTIPEFSFSVMGTNTNPPIIGIFSYSQ